MVPNNRISVIRDEDNYDVVSESTIYSIENSGFDIRSEENSIEYYRRSTETIGHFGNIEIENSSNITFGNKTFFNGPVVIKHLVVDNEDMKVQQHVSAKVETFEMWNKHRPWLIFVIIFVISMIIATSVTGYWLTIYEGDENKSTAPQYEKFMNRSQWGALPPKHEFEQLHNVKRVIIAHTVTSNCSDFANCATILQSIQFYHMNSLKFNDIAYNFMVGGDGVVYEGRGYHHEGAHTMHYNENSICISFIGDFTIEEAPECQLSAAKRIIERGLQNASISSEYILCGQLQLKNTASPGNMLYNQIMLMPHWSKDKCATNN